MKIFFEENIKEAKNLKPGEVALYEYVDFGEVCQDKFICVDGELFFETNSRYNDAKTGAALPCYCRYDENSNFILAVVNTDGSIEIK